MLRHGGKHRFVVLTAMQTSSFAARFLRICSAANTPESLLDLMEIAAFIAQDNPARAKSFVDELEADCRRLVTQPGSGAPRPELGDGVRQLPHGRYLVFYQPDENVVRVARVLHSARDVGTAFPR